MTSPPAGRLVRFALLAIAIGAAACSSVPGSESRGTAGEELVTCGPGRVRVCYPGEGPPSNPNPCYCETPPPPPAPLLTSATGPVCTASTDNELCSYRIPVPPALAGAGCTEGITMGAVTLWACPSTYVPPPKIFGDSTTGGGVEHVQRLDAAPVNGPRPCLTAECTIGPFCSRCLGNLDAGKSFVVEWYDSWHIIGGACNGPCNAQIGR